LTGGAESSFQHPDRSLMSRRDQCFHQGSNAPRLAAAAPARHEIPLTTHDRDRPDRAVTLRGSVDPTWPAKIEDNACQVAAWYGLLPAPVLAPLRHHVLDRKFRWHRDRLDLVRTRSRPLWLPALMHPTSDAGPVQLRNRPCCFCWKRVERRGKSVRLRLRRRTGSRDDR
jgi:hypothetical protein